MRGERLAPGQAGTINLVKLPRGRWAAECYRRDSSGKRRRVRRSGATQAEATRKLRLALNSSGAASIKTVTQLLTEWLRRHDGIAPSTRERYEEAIRRYLVPTAGELRVDEVSTPVVDDLIRHIYVEHSRWAAQRSRSLLSMAFKWGARMGLLTHDFTRDVPLPGREPRVRPWAPSVEQVELLLRLLQRDYKELKRYGPTSPSAWLAAELIAGTGARIGEACAARWEAIDWERGTLTLSDTVVFEEGRNQLRGHLKNEDPRRVVHLPLPLLELLHQHAQADGYIAQARGGGLMSTANLRRAWRRVYTQAGVPEGERVRPHDLRRAVGTKVAQVLGADAASAQLGDTRAITERHYVQPTYEGPPEMRNYLV